MNEFLLRVYDKVVLERPLWTLILTALFAIFFGWQAQYFKLDASADSLVLENDDDLRYFRQINKSYDSEDFLFITYSPHDDILSETSLAGLQELVDDLSKLERVKSVVSILDVPLLNSPRVGFSDISEEIRTLKTPGLDKSLAMREFLESPVYRNLLMSPDGKTTAIQVNFKRDEKYFSLLRNRNDLRDKRFATGLTAEEETKLKSATVEFKKHLAHVLDFQSKETEAVRRIMDKQRHKADMFLGGLPMIISDMIDFIEHDLSVFGVGVVAFMILALSFFFRKPLWVILPLGCCFISALAMMGYLGYMDWRVTVISSNFISILLIITMSLTIHLIVRYGELYAENPNASQRTLVIETVRHMFLPCFYTAITTIVAFSSLVFSGIRPVIDFGWMMTIGITMAFVFSFLFFPSLLVMLRPLESVSKNDATKRLTHAIAQLTRDHSKKILMACAIIALGSIYGISKLQVENRFIDYFKKTTEIYQGMEVIDKQLGGTTPLDLIINADQEFIDELEKSKNSEPEEEDFDDPFADEEDKEKNYWFNGYMLEKVEKIHDYLEELPEIGKVLSIGTTTKVIKHLNGGPMPDDFELAVIRKLLPEHIQKTFVHPYLSADANQIRLTMRIVEADPNLNRQELMDRIGQHLVDEVGLTTDQFRFTGMAVLYNNMLHSLFKSQIQTVGAVFVAIFIMFFILFRRASIAALAIVPNMLAAGLVLGIMGWMRIPLDMMTITIAAITIGIAVDDTIHYIYRFMEEFEVNRNYKADMNRCHDSIGRAIYYTSITVTVGFSILSLSNFIPTIYFGLLTGLAMVVALAANLTLLPLLIIIFKPLGPERTEEPVPATT